MEETICLEKLEAAFEKAIILQLKAAQKHARYNPKFILKLISECGHVGAARQILAGGATAVNPEFTKLWETGMLKFSVEAMICNPRWQPLFDEEEIEVAQARLTAYGY